MFSDESLEIEKAQIKSCDYFGRNLEILYVEELWYPEHINVLGDDLYWVAEDLDAIEEDFSSIRVSFLSLER